MEDNTDQERKWVVDLFAGYGCMRAATKKKGLNYLAVDCRDFISGHGSKLHKTATAAARRIKAWAESGELTLSESRQHGSSEKIADRWVQWSNI